MVTKKTPAPSPDSGMNHPFKITPVGTFEVPTAEPTPIPDSSSSQNSDGQPGGSKFVSSAITASWTGLPLLILPAHNEIPTHSNLQQGGAAHVIPNNLNPPTNDNDPSQALPGWGTNSSPSEPFSPANGIPENAFELPVGHSGEPPTEVATINGVTVSLVAGQPKAPAKVTVAGQVATLSPSAVVIAGQTLSRGGSPITLSGTPVSVGASELIVGNNVIPLPTPPPSPVFTVGSRLFTAYPTGFSVAGSTIVPGAPAVTIFGTPIALGPVGLVVGSSTFNIQSDYASPAIAVIDSSTYPLGPSQVPATAVVDGQTISIGPNGIGFAHTTVQLPTPRDSLPTSVMTFDGLTLSLGQSDVMISGATYAIGNGAPTTFVTIGNEPISFGPGGIGLPETTIPPLPNHVDVYPTPVPTVGLTISIDPSEAIIQGTTYPIGVLASPTSVTLADGEVVSLGPNGVGLPDPANASPTLPVTTTSSAVTADGLTISVNPTEAVISGTTYSIGTGASPTDVVIGGETVSLGPGGVGMPDTTIVPGAAQIGASRNSPLASEAHHMRKLDETLCIGLITAVAILLGCIA